MKSKIRVPKFNTVSKKYYNGKELNPLETIIFDHTPAGIDVERQFYKSIRDLIVFIRSK